MAMVVLGKNHLRWCFRCDVPILEDMRCSICSSDTKEVDVTPPGDVRPAFPHDIAVIKETADRQFGPGSGDALLPDGNIILLNKAPSIDRMDEIIANGCVLANIRYDMNGQWVLLNRMQGALRIGPVMTKGYVICGRGAVGPVRESKNLMAPGVDGVHPDVREFDEIIITDDERNVVATGQARMSAADMMNTEKGVAVKTKRTKAEERIQSGTNVSWEDAIKANEPILIRRRNEAVAFINDTVEKHNVPATVSFSGGKDSLAVLQLTLDAGLKLPVLYVDTGLEFDETDEYVHDTVKRYGLELICERAPAGAFFGNLEHFGPPAKDYRWCCKTNKLGPMVNSILNNFPDGVLSFIGQRRYESESRRASPRIWTSPWVPGQTGAAPIQNWNSLHVWMYIFWKKAPYNIWYTRGLDRIGCFLCPASDLFEAEMIKRYSNRHTQWDSYLDGFSRSRGLPEEWKRFALWRWKRHPQSIQDEVSRVTGKEFKGLVRQTAKHEGPLFLRVQSGRSPCVLGVSVEGAVSRSVDLEKLKRTAGVLSRNITSDTDGQWITVNNVTVFAEGAIISKGSDEKDVRKAIKNIFSMIIRSEECVGCSLCVARCPRSALSIVDGIVLLNAERCTRCGKCIGRCPSADFRYDDEV
jgi:phosphoadenosine phosphosulfate reductase